MLVVNADTLLAKFRFYKIYFVLRKTLQKDFLYSLLLMGGCLVLHRIFPEATWPGCALHLGAAAAWIASGLQTSPLVSLALYVGGKNQMTRVQLMLRLAAQSVGTFLALSIFGFYYSFRRTWRGPFYKFFCIESFLTAAVVFFGCVGYIRSMEAKHSGEKKNRVSVTAA